MNNQRNKSPKQSRTPIYWMTLLAGLVVVISVISLGIGAVFISPKAAIASLIGAGKSNDAFIIMNYRMPRILLALLAGAGLAVSGAVLQGIIRNPLASPDVIGITKGAGLASVIIIILFPKSPVYVLPIAAFLGAALVALALYLLAYKKGVRPASLALVGIALGAIWHAGIQYFMVKYPVDINAALAWLTGSVWGRGWDEVVVLSPWILILLPITIVLAIKLDVLQLGDDLAAGLGEDVEKLRKLLLVISVALAGACVAIVGTIGFVGLVAPHIARKIVGQRHKYLLPTTAMVGMLLLLVADALGRGVRPPLEIPAGVFTAVIGAPYFLYLLRYEKRSR
jgi:ABC-type Fe3+-siderophore transport system permease subunit